MENKNFLKGMDKKTNPAKETVTSRKMHKDYTMTKQLKLNNKIYLFSFKTDTV